MAAVRRSLGCLRLLRSAGRVLRPGRKAAPPVPQINVHLSRTVSLALGGVFSLCAVPFREADNLSHDSLIRRAASLVTDSSSSFLSQTTLALTDALVEYSKAVHTLIALHRRYLDSLGKLTPAEEDSVWQVIIGQRATVDDKLDECKRLELIWVTAVELCETAAEAAYVSGAEQASVVLTTNMRVARSQVEQTQKLAKAADKKLSETKVMEVERMGQHAASLESGNDDEETPDAYLRED